MTLQSKIIPFLKNAILSIYSENIEYFEFQSTRKEFEGDITLVVFPILKVVKGNPTEIGTKIGNYLVENVEFVSKFNVVAGFLNIVITDSYYINFLNEIYKNNYFGYQSKSNNSETVMVEFASPNTNKPLHLGHIRNILLGWSVAKIIEASGKNVVTTQIINDRGIHICKSMLAWQKFDNNETPENTNLKGDKLVGKYYVAFDKIYKQEIQNLITQGKTEEEAKKTAPIILEAQQMLLDWEANKPEIIHLWQTMNQWVYKGFNETYSSLGVTFDSNYYESNTYLLGKEVVQIGLEKGIFEKDPDGSVWIDLTPDGLDRKIVLRSDGTSVYMTQDMGTAIQRVTDYKEKNISISGMVYTVGNEQDYHFKVLFLILKKLGFTWANNLFHLSYGMVELPSGKMKSREGTVVDADDLIADMTTTAQNIGEELGKLDGFEPHEKASLYQTIGLGALKYYILKVDPKKQMLFNPEESVDFAGNTGPFIQYTYARIQSILRKANFDFSTTITIDTLHEKEKELLKSLSNFPEIIQNAAQNYSPALIANYTYELVKEYNSFYQSVSILGEENQTIKHFRVQLSNKVGQTIKNAFTLLGISVPERM